MHGLNILIIHCLFFSTNIQSQEVIYSINEYVTSNLVKVNQEISWSQPRRVQSSYILLRRKVNGLFYMQLTISGQFAYGGYFKYIGIEGSDFKYIRTDETSREDYLYVNYPLKVLSTSQDYDESITLKILNYKTSFGILLKF